MVGFEGLRTWAGNIGGAQGGPPPPSAWPPGGGDLTDIMRRLSLGCGASPAYGGQSTMNRW